MIAGIVAAAAAVVNTSGASASGWAIVNSPNQGGSQNQLNGVACTSSTSCMAVGGYTNAGVEQTMVESWNGSSWSIVASPNQGAGDNQLKGVACTSSTSCVAVGVYSSVGQTLIESWNGIAWAITPSPNHSSSANNELRGVACTSSSNCTAVGDYQNGSVVQTLVESWNGTVWSIIASPNLGTGENVLNGVSCNGSTSCVAVGSSAGQTLAEAWNGTSWSLAASPNQGTGENFLYAVSCASSASCQAVGGYLSGSSVEQTLVVSWNGSSWSLTSTPNRGSGNNSLYGVSCASSTRCMAVGFSVSGSTVEQTLVESWNGSSWTIASSPNQGGGGNLLLGVSCTASSNCAAVAYYRNASTNTDQTLVETWNGTSWSITASPNQGGSINGLSAVSCASSTKCMAVGTYFNGGVQQTLAENWNGRNWSITPSLNQGSSNNGLGGVACTSSTSCGAVGAYTNAGVDQTLVEAWNGSTWTITPSPNKSTTDNNTLNGIACASSTTCVAVGDYFNGSSNTNQTLIESWSGSTWTITPSPNPAGSNSDLTGVACTSSTSCEAVGVSVNGSSIADTLIESWNGSVWSIIPSPNPGGITNELNGVACTSSTSCEAVGDYFNASNVDQTLVERWNGSSWSLTSSPNQGGGNNLLSAVSCTGSTSCVAVGLFFNGSSVEQTVVEGWNGSTWATIASPNQGGSNNGLGGVACAGASTCTAVGDSESSGVPQTLVETGPASAVSSTTFQDKSPSVAFDTWSGVIDATANGGTYRTSPTTSAKATFKFSGTGITWVTRKGPDQGIASVTIDGVSEGTVDLYNASAQSFSQSYSGLAATTHTIGITVTGTKNAASSGTSVVLDALVVGSTTTQDSSTKVTYDTWQGATSSSASGGTYRISGTKNATSTLSFTGTGVDWVTANGPSDGEAAVSIDGVSKGTVDLYASSVQWQVVESYAGLASGTHTIVVTVLGTKNASSTGTKVVVDAFVVHP